MATTMPGPDSSRVSDEQRLAELGYAQELNRSWSGFQNFAISFTIISILAGCFTTYGQAWNNGGPIAISWGWPLISIPILDHRLLHVRARLGLSDGRRDLLVGVQARGSRVGLVHRLVQPHRPRRGDRLGRLRLRHVHERDLRGVRLQPLQRGRRRFFSGTFWLFVVILAFHALVNIAGSHLVARINGISVWWHVSGVAVILLVLIFVPDQARSGGLRLHQRFNNSGFPDGSTCLVLRAPARLPADAVHDHRLRLLRTHLRGDPRRGRERRQGGVAVDLLLGGLRLGPAAGHHVRRRQRRRRQQGRGGGAYSRSRSSSTPSTLGWSSSSSSSPPSGSSSAARAASPAPRACATRSAATGRFPLAASGGRSTDADPVQRRASSWPLGRYHHGPGALADKPGVPVAFFAVVSIAVIGLYIAYVIPIYLRWRMGDAFEAGPLDPRAQVQVDEPVPRSGSRSSRSSSSCRRTPVACRGTTSSTGSSSTTHPW